MLRFINNFLEKDTFEEWKGKINALTINYK